MPGVTVTTAVRTGPVGTNEIAAAQAFLVGSAVRGSVTAPTLVRSLSEYETYYGGFVGGNLYEQVQTFFEEGGSRAYVLRVLSGDAVAGTLTIQDAGLGDSLIATAASPGAWAANLQVAVSISGSNFVLTFALDGDTIYTSRELVDVADAIATINASSINHLVVLSDGGTGLDPDTLALTPLATGADGSALISTDYTDGLDLFGYDLGPGAVMIPGQTGSTVWNPLLVHAVANNRVALLAFATAQTVTGAIAAAQGYTPASGAAGKGDYAAFYYPWIKIPNPALTGLSVDISPEGYAAAARAKAIAQTGTWQPGAGLVSQASFVNGAQVVVNKAEGDLLDVDKINAIRNIAGSMRVYGARSFSTDSDNWRFISFRDTINFIVSEAEIRLEDFVFEPIDSRSGLFKRIEATLVGLLDPIRVSGGLYEAYDSEGNKIDPGYSVEVSDLLNPASQLATGTVAAKVGVRVSSVGDKINITITKSNLTASVV